MNVTFRGPPRTEQEVIAANANAIFVMGASMPSIFDPELDTEDET
jgi:hypothetical protein